MTGSAEKSLILIGPGRYFGAEIISAFTHAGYKVGVIAQSAETIAALQQQGLAFEHERADITDHAAFTASLQALAEQFGGVTCLIYNPKANIKGNGLELSPDDFAKALAINAGGALTAIQSTLPFLKQATQPCVILTGGGYKDQPDPRKFALSVGKAALHGIYLALQQPLQDEGIALKTIVIRTPVRSDTAVSPVAVADLFVQATTASGSTFEI